MMWLRVAVAVDTVAVMGGAAGVVTKLELAWGMEDANSADDTTADVDARVPTSTTLFDGGLETTSWARTRSGTMVACSSFADGDRAFLHARTQDSTGSGVATGASNRTTR
jgi:hypothetical protein